jgi:putative copper export protein
LIAQRALLAWPLLAAQIVVFGTAAFALSLGPGSAGRRDQLIECLVPLWRGAALIDLAISPFTFLAMAAAMADLPWRQTVPLVPDIIRQTHAGAVWEWRFMVVTLFAIAAWLPTRRVVATLVLLALSSVLLFCDSLTSHAIDKGFAAVIIYFIHEIAAALWMGAILCLWLGAVRGRLGKTWLALTAPWVSRLAGWTVAALILSGLYNAYNTLGTDPERLIYAAYGRTLVVKVCAASIVLCIGGYNRFLLIPHVGSSPANHALLRNVAVESVLLIGVIGLAALLANTPPAHHH